MEHIENTSNEEATRTILVGRIQSRRTTKTSSPLGLLEQNTEEYFGGLESPQRFGTKKTRTALVYLGQDTTWKRNRDKKTLFRTSLQVELQRGTKKSGKL